MITTKNYVWPVIKETFSTVFGFLFQIFLGFALAAIFLLIVHFLRWFSIVPFAFIIFCYYVWREAHFAYKLDKDELERKIKESLAWMARLPAHWAVEEDEEKINDSYKRATSDFIQKMEEYEKRYSKNEFYEMAYSDWHNVDRYLRDAIKEKTF